MTTPIYPIDLVITSLETITCYDINTGAFLFAMDELQNASINQTQETQDITGKQGRKLSKIKRNKAVTVSGSNGMVSSGMLSLQTGGSFNGVDEETEVKWVDYLTVKNGKAVTTFKAIGTTGAEIQEIDQKDANGVVIAKLAQADAAAEGKFAYDPATKELTFSTDVADGTEITVTYNRKIKAMVMDNYSDEYSAKATIYLDALGEDKCGNVYRVQFHFPKADFNGEFTFDMGDNQTVHDFEFEALAGACGAGGKLFSYTVFGAEAEDAA